MKLNMLKISYKSKERSLDLFDMKKVKEQFFRHKNICEYEIKCETGFGHTVALGLRRTLLSCMEGVAVVAMKINNAQHIFDSVSGIKESVLDIALNLAKVAFELRGEENSVMINLKRKAGHDGLIVKASDFEKNEFIEILNKDEQICILDNNGEIDLSIIVARGYGYSSALDHVFTPYLHEGFFPVDSYFDNGVHFSYKVEENTSGKVNNDVIFCKLECNGSADELLKKSFLKISKIFSLFEKKESEDDSESTDTEQSLLQMKISDIDELSIRAKNCLLSNNVNNVSDLVERTVDELNSFPGFGDRSLKEVEEFLEKMGLKLGMKINKGRRI